MLMTCSPEKLAACRRNGALSQGPVTEAGKARSRRNALKHGLAGEGIVLADEDVQAVSERFDAFEAELKPTGAVAAALVRRAAFLSVRWERLERQEAASIADNVRHAVENFDAARASALDAATRDLAQDPAAATRQLQRSLEGLAWLVDQWTRLRDDLLDESIPWTPARTTRLENLFGRKLDADFRPSSTVRLCLELEANPDSPAIRIELASRVEMELARLVTVRQGIDPTVLERDRAEAPARALFDAGRAAVLARRYEAATERGFFRALVEIRRLKAEATASSSPKTTSAPVGSFRAEPKPELQPAPAPPQATSEPQPEPDEPPKTDRPKLPGSRKARRQQERLLRALSSLKSADPPRSSVSSSVPREA
jgi:hypothetical protein